MQIVCGDAPTQSAQFSSRFDADGVLLVQIALVALCAAIQLTAKFTQHHLMHPRVGGWKLPWLSEERRLRLLCWIRDLRPRQVVLV